MRSQIDTRPLTDTERGLIAAAETQPWTRTLEDALYEAVKVRGIPVSRYDNCGALVQMLEDNTK